MRCPHGSKSVIHMSMLCIHLALSLLCKVECGAHQITDLNGLECWIVCVCVSLMDLSIHTHSLICGALGGLQ